MGENVLNAIPKKQPCKNNKSRMILICSSNPFAM